MANQDHHRGLLHPDKNHCLFLEMRGIHFLAELFGTFLFILIILASGNFAAIGFTLAAVIFLIGNISGANLNPAVSLVMFLSGKFDILRLFAYMLAQFMGGAAAYYSYNYVKSIKA
jgi:glycerol uptake facilitator-like aquaporin